MLNPVHAIGRGKLARRLHRGDISEDGRPYVDHLARTAALVASYGDECEQMAAWLHDGWALHVPLLLPP